MSQQRKRILVVNDSGVTLEVTKQALETAGNQVTIAQNLTELEQARAESAPLDLILMDVQMPQLFGDDVAMVLKNVHGMSAPIYSYSNLDEDELRTRAANAELDGYICTRDGVEAMVARVESIIAHGSES